MFRRAQIIQYFIASEFLYITHIVFTLLFFNKFKHTVCIWMCECSCLTNSEEAVQFPELHRRHLHIV